MVPLLQELPSEFGSSWHGMIVEPEQVGILRAAPLGACVSRSVGKWPGHPGVQHLQLCGGRASAGSCQLSLQDRPEGQTFAVPEVLRAPEGKTGPELLKSAASSLHPDERWRATAD